MRCARSEPMLYPPLSPDAVQSNPLPQIFSGLSLCLLEMGFAIPNTVLDSPASCAKQEFSPAGMRADARCSKTLLRIFLSRGKSDCRHAGSVRAIPCGRQHACVFVDDKYGNVVGILVSGQQIAPIRA